MYDSYDLPGYQLKPAAKFVLRATGSR